MPVLRQIVRVPRGGPCRGRCRQDLQSACGQCLSSSAGALDLLGVAGRGRFRWEVVAAPRSSIGVLSLVVPWRSPVGLAKKAAHEGLSSIDDLDSVDNGLAAVSLAVASA